MSNYISAKEATKLLKVTRQTLYSYVSRGYIQSIINPKNKKERKYLLNDVQKLLMKKKIPEDISKLALLWGSPVLESKITLIENNKLYYRGQDVINLKTKSFEEVATLIWTSSFDRENALFSLIDIENISYKLDGDSLQEIQKLLLYLESNDEFIYDLNRENIEKTGSKILKTIVALITNNFSSDKISKKLATFYCSEDINRIADELLNLSLILIADHELNSSSFTARNVASSGSTLYQCIIAGISSLLGFRHGGSVFRIDAMVNELALNLNFEKNLQKRRKRGDKIYGYGHNLYPDGDYRAKILLNEIRKHFSGSIKFESLMKINDICSIYSGKSCNIDFVLLVLSRVLDQSVEFAQLIFVLGRISGWIGHILEQYEENRLLRPRAKYIGILPKG